MIRHGSWLALAACFLAGCSQPTDASDRFAFAEKLCLDQQWTEAQEVLREFLLDNPGHAGAHYYLGRAYLWGPDFRPAVAEGELQLALKQYERAGSKSPIERFGDDYFAIICNIESMKVWYKVLLSGGERMQEMGIPTSEVRELVRRMRMYVDRAAAIQPDFQDVLDAEEIVREFETMVGLRPAPEAAAPAA